MSTDTLPQRLVRATQTALTETAFAALGLGASAADLLKDRPDLDEVREHFNSLVRDPRTHLSSGFEALTERGRQVLGREANGHRPAPAPKPKAKVEKAAPTAKKPEPKAKTAEPEKATATTAPDYKSMTVAELREEAKKADITGRSSMKKAELIKALEAQA